MSTLFDSLGIAEFPASTAPQNAEQEPTRSGMRAVADFGVNIGKGAVSGVRMLADTFGADNEVSGGLRTIEEAIGEFASAKSKRDQQRMGEIMAEADGKGWGAELSAALKAAGAAPDALIGQAIGTMVPTVASSMIPGALPARLAAAGVGGAMGVGSAKGSIYEAEQKHWLDRGATAEEAKFLATEAQNYDGANAANIAISGGLGVFAGTSGAEKLARGLVRGSSSDVIDGIGKRVLKGAAGEAMPEAAQGGFEKYTTNSALVNDGAELDPMAGVVGNAALEAAASVPVGGALAIQKPKGPLSRGANVAAESVPQVPAGDVAPQVTEEPASFVQQAAERRATAQALAVGGISADQPTANVSAAATMREGIPGRIQAMESVFSADGGLDGLRAQLGDDVVTELLGDYSVARSDKVPVAVRNARLSKAEATLTALTQDAQADAPEAKTQVLGESLTKTPVEAMLSGGSMAGSQNDPLANMISSEREQDATSETNIRSFAERKEPMAASDAARILEEAKSRGMEMTAAPHPKGGFMVVPRQWVTPAVGQQAEAELADTISRMSKADAAPVERAPRNRTDAVDVVVPTFDPVRDYVDGLRKVNTPAAKFYVGEFDAGRIAPADVQKRMGMDAEMTPDQRLAEAAAKAPAPEATGEFILNPKGQPFRNKASALKQAKASGGSLIEVAGGYKVRKATVEPTAPAAEPQTMPEGGWSQFSQETGTLGVPRAEMPQVKTQHRGAMVNFLNARGVEHEAVEVDAASLKPTQAEFSPEKVERAKESDGKRSILISSDGHIIDGHHQAIAHAEKGEPIKALRLDAPAVDLIPLVNEFPSSTKDAATAADQPSNSEPFTVGSNEVVLQNRDRTTAASIAQMNDIAANPDYMRVGPSREMSSGAPVVFGDMPSGAVVGREETVVDGRGERIKANYAVVEANDLIPSNQADGTPVSEYAIGVPGKLRSVAGNGRTAGLKAAYGRKTASQYRQELEADAVSIGVDPASIQQMSQPVLVRVMRSEDVTSDMGDRTNISGTQSMSPVEQAANDVRRVDLSAMPFNPNGEPSDRAVRGFVQSMPVGERGTLLNADGSPTRQAVDRFMAAVFKQAYESDELVKLYAQATDTEARAVMTALANAAGAMSSLKGTGALDIRKSVSDAAMMAVNAVRAGQKLSDIVKNADMGFSPEAFVVAKFLSENIRSAKKMGEGLMNWAAFAGQQAQIARDNENQSGFFGDQPTITRDQLFQKIGNDNQSDENPGGFGDAPGRAERQTADTRADEAGAAGSSGGKSDEGQQSGLTSPTRADIEAQQARAEKAQRQADADRRKAEEDDRVRRERADIAQASVAAADSFELGQDPMLNLTGQKDIFASQGSSHDQDRKQEADQAKGAAQEASDGFTKSEQQAAIDMLKAGMVLHDREMSDAVDAIIEKISLPTTEDTRFQVSVRWADSGVPRAGNQSGAVAYLSGFFVRDGQLRLASGGESAIWDVKETAERTNDQSIGDQPKLTEAEAKELMAWQDLGTTDGVKTHILTFHESKADKDANRGRMTMATVTKDANGNNAWMVGSEKFGPLAAAKRKAMEVGMAKAVSDGFVERGRVRTGVATNDKTPNQAAAPSKAQYTYTQASKIDTQAQGVLANAKEQKARAFKRLKFVRQKVKDREMHRLELIKAESAHKDAILAVLNAESQLEKEANRKGLTTIKSKAEVVSEPDVGVAMFSRGGASTGTTPDRAQQTVDAIKARWSNAPDVVVVSDMQDAKVPQAVRDYDAQQRSVGASGEPEGFWFGGKAYIVAGSLKSDNDVARVLFHEVLGHYGLRGVFGDQLAPILKQIAALRKKEVEAKATKYGLDVSVEAERLHAAEEVLAEMAQTTPENGYVKRAVAAIRAWLRKNIPGFANMKLSDAEIIQQYILPARRFVEGGGPSGAPSGGPGGGISFSRSNGETAASGGTGWREMSLVAGYKANDFLKSSGKISWWHKTVGTQYNLAQRHYGFRAVFESVQRFIGDASYYSAEAAAYAPTVLPKLEGWKDVFKSPLSAEDTAALSAPVFDGTLNYGRTINGGLYKVSDLKKALAGKSEIELADTLARLGIETQQDVDAMKAKPEVEFKADLAQAIEKRTMNAGTVFSDSELKSEFGLNARQIGLYKEVRNSIDKSLKSLAISHMVKAGGKDLAHLKDRAMGLGLNDAAKLLSDELITIASSNPTRSDSLGDVAQAIEKALFQTKSLMQKGYAPLSRFGNYTLEAKTADGEYHFSMHDSEADRNKAARMLEADGATVQEMGTMSQEEFKLLNSISPESIALFGEILGLDSQGDAESDAAFQAFLQKAIANQSAMKRLIHRKGTAGYNEDVGRVLAGFVYSNGRLTSANLHKKDAADAAKAIKKADGEAKDAALKLIDYVQNPTEEAQAFRAFLFAQYLGGSVASAVMNATQPLTMTLPYLSQFGGATKAAKALAGAMQYANGKATANEDLNKALRHAEEEGIVSPQEIHQLLSQSMGKSQLKAGDWNSAAGLAAKASNTASKVAFAWGKVFGLAEQFNRRITFIAAYNMAVDRDIADPATFAKKAVHETQGIYNKGNKPQWARGALGSILFTFKQFTIGYVEWLARMANAGEPGSSERKAGQRAVGVALGVLFLTAGIGGLPGADDLDDLIDGVMQRMGHNFSTKQAKREFLIDFVGEAGADFVLGGITALPGSPVDLSGRFGIGNIIPGTGFLTAKTDRSRDFMEILGPGGDFALRVLSGADKLSRGDVVGGVRDVLPRAAENFVKGSDMARTDMYLDKSGKNVTGVDLADSAAKFFGFQPKIVKDAQQSTSEVQRAKAFWQLTKSDIQEQLAKAKFERDTDAERKVRERVADWNRKNPGQRIAINMPAVLKRVRNMRMTKAERTIASTPKALRAEVRAQLEEVR